MADEEISILVVLRRVRAFIRDTLSADRAIRKLGDDVEDLDHKSKKTTKSTEKLDTSFRDVTKTAGDWIRNIKNTDVSMARVNVSFTFFRNILRSLSIPVAITGFAFMTQALGALGSGVVGLVSALAPLVTNLAALPGLASAAAQGFGVFAFATSGITKALGGNDQALAALSDQALSFYVVLVDLMPQVDALRAHAQAGLFPGLGKGITEAFKNFDVVDKVVTATAKTLGGLSKNFGTQLGSPIWGRDLQTLGMRNVVTIQAFGGAAISLANALRDLMIVSWPLVQLWTELTVKLSDLIQTAIAGGRKTGKLESFFERVATLTKLVGAGLIDFGIALWNIFAAAVPLGGWVLGGLLKSAKDFRNWTESWTGKLTMAKFFMDAKAPLKEMALLAKEIVISFFMIASQPGIASLIKSLRVDLLPVLTEISIGMSDAFGPSIVTSLAQIATLMGVLASETGPLTWFVRAFGLMALILAKILETPVLGHFLMGMLVFAAVANAVKIAVALMIGPFVKLAIWLPKLTEGLAIARGWMFALGNTALILRLRLMALAAAERTAAIASTAFSASLLTNPIVLITVAIIALVAALVVLYYKWGWFHDRVDQLWRWIKNNWPLLGLVLTGPFGAAVVVIIANWDTIKSASVEAFNFLIGYLGQAGMVLLNTITMPFRRGYETIAWFWGLIKFVTGQAVLGLGMILQPLKDVFNWVIDKMKWILGKAGDVAGVVGAITGAVGKPLDLIGVKGDGGPIMRSGSYLVGDRGPEVVTLPRGAGVIPNNALSGNGSGVKPLFDEPGYINDRNKKNQPIQLLLDGRVVAETNARYASDKQARL